MTTFLKTIDFQENMTVSIAKLQGNDNNRVSLGQKFSGKLFRPIKIGESVEHSQIRTSPIKEIVMEKDMKILIKTLNSTYLVEAY